jgi:hypothetical protein
MVVVGHLGHAGLVQLLEGFRKAFTTLKRKKGDEPQHGSELYNIANILLLLPSIAEQAYISVRGGYALLSGVGANRLCWVYLWSSSVHMLSIFEGDMGRVRNIIRGNNEINIRG